MATSGSTDFNLTRDDIVAEAMELLGLLAPGETPKAQETQTCQRSLNMMLKAWQADGINLWTQTEATLLLTAGTASYTFPGARAAKTVVSTTTTAAALSGATTITVSSIAGISATNTIGVELDDGTLHWTAVNGAPSGSTVPLTTGLAGDAASGATVYVYASVIGRPLRITTARRHNIGQDTPIIGLNRDEYFALPNKSSTGIPTQYYYDPQQATGVLYLWPAPSSVEDSIKFTYTRRIEDVDTNADDLDLPQEWFEPVAHNLAVRIAPKFGISITTKPELVAMAENGYNLMKEWDSEPESIHFMPSHYGPGY